MRLSLAMPRSKARATIHLAGQATGLRGEGKLAGLPWRSGTIDAEGTLATSGTGTALLGQHAGSRFVRRQGNRSGCAGLVRIGDRDRSNGRGTREIRSCSLPQLVMKTGADTYLGSAEMEDNGQLVIKVSDGTRHIQAAGAILRGERVQTRAIQ